MKLKIGEKVRIISGKFKGLEGNITQFKQNKQRVIVGGINIVKVHQKPSQMNPDGGIFEKEASIHISNVALPTKTKVKFVKAKADKDSKKKTSSKQEDKTKTKKVAKKPEKKVAPKTEQKPTKQVAPKPKKKVEKKVAPKKEKK